MSGHSHWATTQRAKGIKDNARGKVFSKLSRQITIAVKEGGGTDPNANYRLRIAIETARAENMPKENIERAINKSSTAENLSEMVYEGFGPGGVNVIIEATTDNKNRAAQEVKGTLEKFGGSLGGPNSVSFNFASKGFILIEKQGNLDDQVLAIIDSGVEDYEDTPHGIELYTEPHELYIVKEKLIASGFNVLEAKLIKKPLNTVTLSEHDEEKLHNLIATLDELDDVDEVFVNAA